MPEPYALTPSKEYPIRLETTVFTLLIEGDPVPDVGKSDEYPLLHDHEFTELFVCCAGEIALMTGTGDLILRAGDLAVIPPGVPHKSKGGNEGAELFSVSFSAVCRTGKDCALLHRLTPFLSGDAILLYRGVPDFCREVRRIVCSSDTLTPQLFLVSLLLHLSEDCVPVPISSPSGRAPITGEIRCLMKLDEIVEGHYMLDWSIEKISEALHVSARQIDRIAQKRYGKSIRQQLFDKRCQRAEHLLTTTDLTTGQIAVAVGFHSAKTLQREFSRRYGKTPASYRKEQGV